MSIGASGVDDWCLRAREHRESFQWSMGILLSLDASGSEGGKVILDRVLAIRWMSLVLSMNLSDL